MLLPERMTSGCSVLNPRASGARLPPRLGIAQRLPGLAAPFGKENIVGPRRSPMIEPEGHFGFVRAEVERRAGVKSSVAAGHGHDVEGPEINRPQRRGAVGERCHINMAQRHGAIYQFAAREEEVARGRCWLYGRAAAGPRLSLGPISRLGA